jgi:hypothetical protein
MIPNTAFNRSLMQGWFAGAARTGIPSEARYWAFFSGANRPIIVLTSNACHDPRKTDICASPTKGQFFSISNGEVKQEIASIGGVNIFMIRTPNIASG